MAQGECIKSPNEKMEPRLVPCGSVAEKTGVPRKRTQPDCSLLATRGTESMFWEAC